MTARPRNRNGEITVALERHNQLLQKYLATRTAKERELELMVDGDPVTGFVAAVDDGWLQITDSKTLQARLINLDYIATIRETSRVLSQLPENQQREIREYTEVFAKISRREVERLND